MAKGHDKHQARLDAINRLGRNLARRASSRCELCETSASLSPLEVPPLPEEPELERTVLLCERCHTGATRGRIEADDWRFLEQAMWNETAAAQVIAVRLLQQLAKKDVHWARAALDGLYLDPEVEEWVAAGVVGATTAGLIDGPVPHRALDDARLTLETFRHYIGRLAAREPALTAAAETPNDDAA